MFFRKRKKKKEEKAPEITVYPYNYSFEKDALNLARFIINKSNELDISINNSKLQRLLYFTQSAFLMGNNGEKGIFEDEIRAWAYGPTVPSVYGNFKMFGDSSIPPIERAYVYFPKKEITFKLNPENNTYYAKEYENGLYVREMKWHSPFNEKEEKAITYIIEKFKDYSHYNLIDMVHKQKPWLDAYESGRDNVITNESIYEYFERLGQ